MKEVSLSDKRDVIKRALAFAKEGDVRWAEWLVKHSGEGANIIEDVREAGGTLSFTLHLDSPMEQEGE